jgi:Fe-S cluster biogenesis protein NfuA
VTGGRRSLGLPGRVILFRMSEGVESIEERVNQALDKVRPAIQGDGGEVWLMRVADDTAYVQMLGACGGCPASTMTLKGAIEAIVVADVPEIKQVLQV